MSLSPRIPNSSVLAWFCTALIFSLATACGSDKSPEPETPASEETQAPAARVASQEVVSETGPNYFLVGGSYVDLIGPDRDTDKAAGRLVNAGDGLNASSVNDQFWLVLGRTGQMAVLDREGKVAKGTPRTPLSFKAPGEEIPVYFAEYGTKGNSLEPVWLVGGGSGRIAYIDGATADPFTDPNGNTAELLGAGVDLTAASFDAVRGQWLIGASDGRVVGVSANDLSQVLSNVVAFTTPIQAVLTNPDVANNDSRWLVLSERKVSFFPTSVPLEFDAGITVTTATLNDTGDVMVGAQDGKVAIWKFDDVGKPGATWVEALPKAVEKVYFNGTDWLVLGQEGWARVMDVTGAPKGEAVQLGDGSTLKVATWSQGRWLIGTDLSIIVEADAALKVPATYTSLLDDQKIWAAMAGGGRAVIAGAQGKYRMLNQLGKPLGEVQTTKDGGTIYDISWDGTNFLLVGEGGKATLINPEGEPQGDGWTLLDGKTARTAAWSGTFWLVAGDEGYTQRLRGNGEISGEPNVLDDIDTIHTARWNGDQWLVGGEKGGEGRIRFVTSDGRAKVKAEAITAIKAIYSIDWSGFEWLVGGSEGIVQLVSASGIPRVSPQGATDVLFGQDVRSITFQNDRYAIAGQGGLVRFIGKELQLPEPPLAMVDFEDIQEIVWTTPRGYGQGDCLTETACFKGKCLTNTAGAKFCCDTACDRGCESCFKAQTNQEDGICVPLTEGAMPVSTTACAKEDESTCGNTGLCDGQGECQIYDNTVMCQGASCEQNQAVQAGICDGTGTCVVPDGTACAPFNGCTEAGNCKTSCMNNDDCVDGLVCDAGNCVEQMEMGEVDMGSTNMPEPPKKEESGGDDGGCSTTQGGTPTAPLALLAGFLMWGWRRRD